MDDLREVIARVAHAKKLREINHFVWANRTETDIRERIEANWPYGKKGFLDQADAALAAIKQAGFVVVPAEPTPRMLDAGRYAICGEPDTHADTTEASGDCYRAMIEASNG